MRKRCSKGKSCGGTCINRGLVCQVGINPALSSSLKGVRGEVLGSHSPGTPGTASVKSPVDTVQDLALEVRRKRMNKEDHSQEWRRLVGVVNSLEGDAKRDATIKANAARGKRLEVKVEHKAESKEKAQAAGKKLLAEYKTLGRTVEMINRYEALFSSVAKRLEGNLTPEQVAQVSKSLTEINARKGRAEKRLEEIMEGVRDKMMQTSLTDRQVKDLVSRVWTPNTSEATRGHMTEFVKMFNGRGFTDMDSASGSKPVRSLSETTERAHAIASKGIVKTDGNKNTTFHELAHMVEGQRPWMSKFAVQWRDGKAYDNIQDIRKQLNRDVSPQGFYKTGPNTSAPIVKLKDMFAGSNYGEGEVAVVDKFFHKYMGRVYGAKTPWKQQGTTEVWSMVMEYFSSPQGMAIMYRAHPELFETVAGLAASP